MSWNNLTTFLTFQIDLRDDAATIEKLAKNKQKPLSLEMGEKLAKELRAVKYVECSALTQVSTTFFYHFFATYSPNSSLISTLQMALIGFSYHLHAAA